MICPSLESAADKFLRYACSRLFQVESIKRWLVFVYSGPLFTRSWANAIA
jgi:hypothetical protein